MIHREKNNGTPCKGRVLIVDDDPGYLNTLSRAVEEDGYVVKTKSTGIEALEMISNWDPSIVLLGTNIPEKNGLEALKAIRDSRHGFYLPVLLITAETSMAAKRKGFEAGADDFITKPFNPEDLRLRIGAHLRRYRQSSEAERYIPDHTIKVPITLERCKSGMFRKWYRISKRWFDFTVSLAVLPIALPAMAVIAFAVKMDSPGPAVFFQERTGLDGRRFRMIKFRTMVEDAEELKVDYQHLNELTWPDFKMTHDPRMTKVGRILRKTSLDELPQLINILLGDMSLVGPRPTSFKADTYQLWQTERLEIRPGLTGLWQVSGRSNVDFIERVEMDIEYLERQSWCLDIKIIWLTVATVIHGSGAS